MSINLEVQRELLAGSDEKGGMSSSRKRMLSDSLMSMFIMVARIALNHKLGRIFWHSMGICKSEAPCFRRKLSMCRDTLVTSESRECSGGACEIAVSELLSDVEGWIIIASI